MSATPTRNTSDIAADVLDDLNRRGVSVRLDGDEHVIASGPVTDDDVNAIRSSKPGIVRVLSIVDCFDVLHLVGRPRERPKPPAVPDVAWAVRDPLLEAVASAGFPRIPHPRRRGEAIAEGRQAWERFTTNATGPDVLAVAAFLDINPGGQS